MVADCWQAGIGYTGSGASRLLLELRIAGRPGLVTLWPTVERDYSPLRIAGRPGLVTLNTYNYRGTG